MKSLLIALLIIVTPRLHGATPPRGNERLRELAVTPALNMTLNFSVKTSTFIEDLTEEGTPEDWIEQARNKLKIEPDDLLTQVKLGRLLNANDDTNAARFVYEKAAALGRKRLEQRPNDGVNLTLLADAVWSLGNKVEAESLYRRATAVASNDWHGWVGLGDMLCGQAALVCLELITDSKHESEPTDKKSIPTSSLEYLDEAIKRRHEASICFQRAYEIAPREFEVLLRCGQYRSYSNWQATIIQRYRTDPHVTVEKQAQDMIGMFFSPVARQDYEKALAIRPQSYKLITMLAFAEWSQVLLDAQRLDSSTSPTLDDLPEKSKQVIVGYIQRLKDMSDGPDKKLAAAALSSLWICRMRFDDAAADFTPELQRAVAYDPTNEQAWNLLIGLSFRKVTPEQLTELCERRLKAKKNARNHLILAKAMYRQKRFKEAVDQTKAAQQLEPENPSAAIMRLALAIRQEATVEELFNWLDASRSLAKQLTSKKEKREAMREGLLNFSIICGLTGNSDEGREALKLLLKEDEDDEVAREILNALP